MSTDYDYPKIYLPDDHSEGYWSSYDVGTKLEEAFPGQDAYDLVMAMDYNDVTLEGLDPEKPFSRITMLEQGQNDGDDWVWYLVQGEGYASKRWIVRGGCDYTGWDCRSAAYAFKV